MKQKYWIGKKPSDGKAWSYTERGMVIEDLGQREAIFRMYRRYVKQWNDVELDLNRSLHEHTHEVLGAGVVGSPRAFILHSQKDPSHQWILEVWFARGFQMYHPGLSCGLNALRSPSDMRSTRLHWSGFGDQGFIDWLLEEERINADKGEATGYLS